MTDPFPSPDPDGEELSAAEHAEQMVFVVEDDPSMREALALLIRRAGWQPQTFGSAREFLAHRRVAVPSCLLLDVGLPDLHGLELQRRLGEQSANMPIIFVTGCADISTSVQAMKAGAVDFLMKPFSE